MAARPAITLAIDQVLRDGAAPLFKERGFRKRGRAWRRQTERCVCAVSAQASDANHGHWGRFTFNMGFAYTALVEEAPETWQGYGFPHHERSEGVIPAYEIGRVVPSTGWWQFDDARDTRQVQLVQEQLVAALERHVLTFVEACDDPRAFRNHRLHGGGGYYVLESAAISAALGDRLEVAMAMDRWIIFNDSRGAEHPDVADYVDVLPHLEAVGLRLNPYDAELAEHRLRVALQEPRTGDGSARLSKNDLARLAQHLGLDMATLSGPVAVYEPTQPRSPYIDFI